MKASVKADAFSLYRVIKCDIIASVMIYDYSYYRRIAYR